MCVCLCVCVCVCVMCGGELEELRRGCVCVCFVGENWWNCENDVYL